MSNLQIQVDSREKARAIKKIVAEFDKQGVQYFTSKLYVGDYMELSNPKLFIDRKQSIAEIAQNATSGHKRFKNELVRCDDIGGKMIILIEQDTCNGEPIDCLEDIILWEPVHSTIVGERIYRVLKSWEYKHNVEFQFCSKRDTGKRIIQILGGG